MISRFNLLTFLDRIQEIQKEPSVPSSQEQPSTFDGRGEDDIATDSDTDIDSDD